MESPVNQQLGFEVVPYHVSAKCRLQVQICQTISKFEIFITMCEFSMKNAHVTRHSKHVALVALEKKVTSLLAERAFYQLKDDTAHV